MPTHFLSAKWDAEQRWGAEWSFQKWPKQTFTCLTCEHGWKIHQHQNPLSIKIGTSHLGNISGDQPHRPEVRHPKLIHINPHEHQIACIGQSRVPPRCTRTRIRHRRCCCFTSLRWGDENPWPNPKQKQKQQAWGTGDLQQTPKFSKWKKLMT